MEKVGVAEVLQFKNDIVFTSEKSVVLEEWVMGGWMDGWMGVKAVLRIAYSNQKNLLKRDTSFPKD